MTGNKSTTNTVIILIVAIISAFTIYVLMQPERTPVEKMGDAMEEMADGAKDAADELK